MEVKKTLLPPFKPRVNPEMVNLAFMAGTTFMLIVALGGMQVYAVEALSSNMRSGFRALECAPEGVYVKRRCE